MDWLYSFLVFAFALGCRVYLNRGQTSATPDEGNYMRYSSVWRPGTTYANLVDGFLERPKLEIPPTRYIFFAICAAVVAFRKTPIPYRTLTWVSSTAGALAAPVAYQITHNLPASLLVAGSPLSLLLGRKALQDTAGALTILLGLWAIQAGSVWGLAAAVVLAVGSREALLLYLPALFVAWGLKTKSWEIGAGALAAGTTISVALYYALGGRRLPAVLRKLSNPTDYVLRVQAGAPHRLLIDQMFVSPVTMVAALAISLENPVSLVAFIMVSLLVHSLVIPKNVRFMLAVDLGFRMMCAALPGPWPWIVWGIGSLSDFFLYRALHRTMDPVTYDLVLKTGMFIPPEVAVEVRRPSAGV